MLLSFSWATELNERVINYRHGLWDYFPLRQLVFIEKSINEGVVLINQYKNQNIDFKINQNDSNKASVIFVIGETSRRSSLNIYGSKYNTTPYMTNLATNYPENITFFPDMVSIAPFTRVAVPSLLSFSNASHYNKVSVTPSIFKILKPTDIETTFVTIRNKNSFHESLLNEIIKDNRNITNLDKKYDGDLLPDLYKYIDNNSDKKKLITFHLTGSHYIYKKRYPIEFNCFEPDIFEANYLSSLRYTDFVLSKIIKYIEKNSKPYVLIYISDHGEYANDNGDEIYGHGFKKLTKNEIEIPLVFVYNK
jgi:heptose-I-phosphate ethanolaminephosphotransferase